MKQQYVEKVKNMTGEQFMDALNEAKTPNGGTALLMARGADRLFDLNDMASIPSYQRGGAFNPDHTMGWKRCQQPYDKYFASYDGKIKGPQGGVLATSINNAGYMIVPVTVGGRHTSVPLHRLVASAWLPDFTTDRKFVIDHLDDMKTNCAASNLEVVSYSQNLTKPHRMKQMAGHKGAKNKGVPVVKVDEDGTRTTYRSASAAAKDNKLSTTSVMGNAKGQLHIDKPYHFELTEH